MLCSLARLLASLLCACLLVGFACLFVIGQAVQLLLVLLMVAGILALGLTLESLGFNADVVADLFDTGFSEFPARRRDMGCPILARHTEPSPEVSRSLGSDSAGKLRALVGPSDAVAHPAAGTRAKLSSGI